MKTLIIPPCQAPTVEDLPDKLHVWQRLVGGDIEAVRWPGRDDVTCYVNGDGKYTESCEHNPMATKLLASVMFRDDWVAGTLVVLGFDYGTGEHRDVPADIANAVLAIKEYEAAVPELDHQAVVDGDVDEDLIREP